MKSRTVSGFGMHTVEHRAIDAAGNVGAAESYRATVLPGSSPACTRTLSGRQAGVTVTAGTTCLTDAQVTGQVVVRAGASLVVRNSSVTGPLSSTGAQVVQVFGSTITGTVAVADTRRDVTFAGNRALGAVTLTGNTQLTANERYSRLAGAYGPVLAGNQITGALVCSANSALPKDFGAPNVVHGAQSGACSG